MTRRPALALALALALVVTTGGFAAAANYGLLTRTKTDPVGHLNATNVADLSPTPVVPAAASEPVSALPAEVAVDPLPIDETPVEAPVEAPAPAAAESGGTYADDQQAPPVLVPSVTPPAGDYSWLEAGEPRARERSAQEAAPPQATPTAPTTSARPATTSTTERHDDDDDKSDDKSDDEDDDKGDAETEERDD